MRMKFFSDKIYLQDAPKSFGDFCKEASLAKSGEMTKVAQSLEVEAEDSAVEPSEDSGSQELPEQLQAAIDDVRDQETDDMGDDVFASNHSGVLKVASIDANEDGTVTVEFGKIAMEDCCETCNEELCQCEEACTACDEEDEEEGSEAYANNYGKFIKVSNLTSNQKDYLKNYWNSVWPKEFTDALLTDQ